MSPIDSSAITCVSAHRYHVKAPEGLSLSEEEAFEGEVAIPTRLRSVVDSKHTALHTCYIALTGMTPHHLVVHCAGW